MHWQNKNTDAVLKELKSGRQGLTVTEAETRLEKIGRNAPRQRKPPSLLKRFLAQLSDKMIIILIIAAMISFAISAMTGESTVDSFIILLIVLVNAAVGVIQENKAEKAIEALRSLSSPHCTVIRSGKRCRVLGDPSHGI